MNPDKKNNFAIRLKLARKMAGLSLQELADKLENKVTKQSLSKYENGSMKPSSEVILALANTLKLKPDYFLKTKLVEFGEVSFRKKVRLAKKQEESIVEKVRDYVERHIEIENILDVEHQFENPLENFEIKNLDDVEVAANKLREVWKLGINPISNLVEMLELNGIKVFLVEEVEDFEGLAVFTSKGIPIVVLNVKDKPIERIRFTIIHELAHILLNLTAVNDNKTIESFCHYFSSNFLLPKVNLVKLIGASRKYIRIQELITIKESYGISIRAIVYRLKQIGVIPDSYYRRWMIYMSKTYGKKIEPGNYKGEEKPTYFDQLINRALAEEIISISKASALWNVSINEIRKGYKGA